MFDKDSFRDQMNQQFETHDQPPLHSSEFGTVDQRTGTAIDRNVKKIQLDRIVADKQVREHFAEDALEELANSLRTHGQKQACLVYWDEERTVYCIIAGERRFRAAKMAGLESLICYVHPQKPTEEERAELQVIENLIRKDLTPLELANAYNRFLELGWSTRQIADRVGVSQSKVSRVLQILKLPEDIQQEIAAGTLPSSLVRQLAKCSNQDEQRELIDQHKRGEITTAQPKKKAARTSSDKTKNVTFDGLKLSAKLKKGQTNSDLAVALLSWCERVLDDGRSGYDGGKLRELVDAVRDKLGQLEERQRKAA